MCILQEQRQDEWFWNLTAAAVINRVPIQRYVLSIWRLLCVLLYILHSGSEWFLAI